MHNNQLQKVINLAKKTGDRIIVIDKNNLEDIFVIINFDEYEKIICNKTVQINNNANINKLEKNLTEQESLDKINQDIAYLQDIVYLKDENESNEDYEDLDDDIEKYNYKKHWDRWEEDEDLDDEEDDEEEEEEDEEYEDEEQYTKKHVIQDFEKEYDRPSRNSWQIPSQVKQKAKNITEEEKKAGYEEQ
ncbi:hypothetical protein KJ978_02690, partial [Patescibacteria group bacterium]|nr:hypothetical protein [Patescibacteria group bacterium]